MYVSVGRKYVTTTHAVPAGAASSNDVIDLYGGVINERHQLTSSTDVIIKRRHRRFTTDHSLRRVSAD